MLLKNIIKWKVDSAVENMPKLDNMFDKKHKKPKAMKVRKGPYGGVGFYHPIGLSADVPTGGGDTGGGGDGGGGGGD